MRPAFRRVVGPLLLTVVAGVAPLTEADPATAATAGGSTAAVLDLGFAAAGFFPTFPCPTGCGASFSGTAEVVGSAHATAADGQYDATFALSPAGVLGSLLYTEPAMPSCPAVGFAAGSVTIFGSGALGVVTRAGTSPAAGTVHGMTLQLEFTLVRTGVAATAVVTGGTGAIHYTFPDTGAGSFTGRVLGGGLGAFALDALDVVLACAFPTSVYFLFHGDAALTLT